MIEQTLKNKFEIKELELNALLEINCYDDSVRDEVKKEADAKKLPINIVNGRGWYFL